MCKQYKIVYAGNFRSQRNEKTKLKSPLNRRSEMHLHVFSQIHSYPKSTPSKGNSLQCSQLIHFRMWLSRQLALSQMLDNLFHQRRVVDSSQSLGNWQCGKVIIRYQTFALLFVSFDQTKNAINFWHEKTNGTFFAANSHYPAVIWIVNREKKDDWSAISISVFIQTSLTLSNASIAVS